MLFTTTIRAIDPIDGELKKWTGPNIESISFKMAEQYCQENGLGYLNVDGILVADGHLDKHGNIAKITHYDYTNN